MTDNTTMICPICGSDFHASGFPGISCDKCGLETAFVRYFAGKESKRLWEDKVAGERGVFMRKKRDKFSRRDYFALSDDSVAYISSEENNLLIFGGDGTVEERKNVLQYSRSERNAAILFGDGKVEASGENDYGQCGVHGLSDVSAVLCAPNCIYAICRDGRVKVSGTAVDREVESWQNISAMACGSYHVLGLTKDSKVKIAGDRIEKSVIDKVSQWENVKAVCASTDCSIALFQDGTVAFAGRKNDSRGEAESWENIVAVKADSAYIVGLTKGGDVKLAGSCKEYLDMGRFVASEWKNVIAIACSRWGIAAIFMDGTISIAGHFAGDAEMVGKKWRERVKI